MPLEFYGRTLSISRKFYIISPLAHQKFITFLTKTPKKLCIFTIPLRNKLKNFLNLQKFPNFVTPLRKPHPPEVWCVDIKWNGPQGTTCEDILLRLEHFCVYRWLQLISSMVIFDTPCVIDASSMSKYRIQNWSSLMCLAWSMLGTTLIKHLPMLIKG